MLIRKATKFDIPNILNMLRHYRDAGKVIGVADITSDETPIRILTYIMAGGGCAYVSQKDDKLTGMLLALKTPYLWDNTKFIMSEIVYWTEQEYRGSTAGYRLLAQYVKHCTELKDDNDILNYTISQMEGQTLNYSRFGFKPVEHTWSL
jgi:hypothetical protein